MSSSSSATSGPRTESASTSAPADVDDTTTTYGHPPPVLLTLTILPISFLLILNPLLPILLPASLLSYLPTSKSETEIDHHHHLTQTPLQKFPALQANIGFALLAFVGACWVVPKVGESFVNKGLKGRDLLKRGGRVSGPWVPECLGLPCASLYLALMMLFIPFPFSHLFKSQYPLGGPDSFPQRELTLYLSSLLSLLTATLLGFIDDLFDIRWRHKLPIPIVAAVPTLLVYYSVGGVTSVVLPKGVSGWLNTLGLGNGSWIDGNVVDLGPIYYIYLVLLPTFTTNSINILAGINGVEVLQALIIALSVAFNDLLFLPIWAESILTMLGVNKPQEGRMLEWAIGEVVDRHLMSLYFMAPLIGICLGFLWHNWYPARAFPGDTFCYFTGMAFGAVAIQGHFSKTLILFFIPQIFNFILSCPQLFGLVECPRHRLPSFDEATGLLNPSRVIFEKRPPKRTAIVLEILSFLRLVRLERSDLDAPSVSAASSPEVEDSKASGAKKQHIKSSTNLTIINFLLVHFGPTREDKLCALVGAVQVLCSVLAFGIRYGVGSWFYGGDRR
ncbi:UDP-N-acetylglucosamine-dolichyl-phosphate N-acetylglucosaminephosphotransferase [Kwoniella heveanensis BCC8398]|uniref:UDP-N-acetylglucosamine--dolichyl-phosphate N-acetylglucosaminephosphotransferase n=1 Tax=Kwoniella heveanensis BCC8398 TaxID=1296120 RepID=A0A1B9GZ65_9TREE|nr:UDP-N-acetylglucosamine-dolichyl-phosphate N-acetylglucosaminephosphotransferase [Kwoniella heveanensis BCC8398]